MNKPNLINSLEFGHILFTNIYRIDHIPATDFARTQFLGGPHESRGTMLVLTQPISKSGPGCRLRVTIILNSLQMSIQ